MNTYIEHHGILGQKWGVRRYQNKDMSLTSAGRHRYYIKKGETLDDISSHKGIERRLNDLDKAMARNQRKIDKNIRKNREEKNKDLIERNKAGQEETKRLLKRASKLGYKVNSKSVFRDVTKGREKIAAWLLSKKTSGLTTAAVIGAKAVSEPGIVQKGTKYKVKD